jgi:hypothetical protein
MAETGLLQALKTGGASISFQVVLLVPNARWLSVLPIVDSDKWQQPPRGNRDEAPIPLRNCLLSIFPHFVGFLAV